MSRVLGTPLVPVTALWLWASCANPPPSAVPRPTAHTAAPDPGHRDGGAAHGRPRGAPPEPPAKPPAKPSDVDHDGVPDPIDACPARPETYEGTTDDDGCPDGPSLVRFSEDLNRIELLARVSFSGADDAKVVPDQPVLEHLAAVLRAHPDLKVEVEGHGAPRHDAYGLRPTQRRADNVRRSLVALGVGAERITAVGYGETRPIASNKTKKGRRTNNRIEVRIIVPASR